MLDTEPKDDTSREGQVLAEKPPAKNVKALLNKKFREGAEAWEVLEEIRFLNKPIITDFNCVLVNNIPPIIPNPEAYSFLNELREIGDVVVVTTYDDWEDTHAILERHGLWFDDMVLMVRKNWGFMAEYDPRLSLDGRPNPHATELISEFIELRREGGDIFGQEDFDTLGYHHKKIGPILGKEHDIPIIDDDADVVMDNPGMYGIIVKPFAREGEVTTRSMKNALSLEDAVVKVRNFYDSLQK